MLRTCTGLCRSFIVNTRCGGRITIIWFSCGPALMSPSFTWCSFVAVAEEAPQSDQSTKKELIAKTPPSVIVPARRILGIKCQYEIATCVCLLQRFGPLGTRFLTAWFTSLHQLGEASLWATASPGSTFIWMTSHNPNFHLQFHKRSKKAGFANSVFITPGDVNALSVVEQLRVSNKEKIRVCVRGGEK